MPTAITADRISDIVLAYHKKVITKRKVVDLLQQYRNSFFGHLVNTRLKRESRHDHSFYFNYMLGGFSNGQWDSFYNPDSTSRANLLSQGSCKWAMHKTNFVLDRREPSFPKSNSANIIVNHIAAQETNMYQGFFADMEVALWTLATGPNDGTTGDPIMNGIPYQVVSSTTDAVGFNGGNPSGYSAVNGHSRTTYPQLKNGTANFDSMSPGDFVDKANSLLNLMHWEMPRTDDLVMTFGNDYEMVSTRNMFEKYQQMLSASHEAGLVPDAGKHLGGIPAGTVIFKGIRWRWSDALSSQYLRDQTTVNPAYSSTDKCYFLKWPTWEVYGADDFFMTVDPPSRQNDPHNTVVTHMNTMLNTVCIAPHENAVMDSNYTL